MTGRTFDNSDSSSTSHEFLTIRKIANQTLVHAAFNVMLNTSTEVVNRVGIIETNGGAGSGSELYITILVAGTYLINFQPYIEIVNTGSERLNWISYIVLNGTNVGVVAESDYIIGSGSQAGIPNIVTRALNLGDQLKFRVFVYGFAGGNSTLQGSNGYFSFVQVVRLF